MKLELTHIAAVFLGVADALQKQTARTGRPVTNRHAGLRLKNFGHQEALLGRGVELAAGFARIAGEVTDQVFVGVAEQVIGNEGAVEGLTAEVIDQIDLLVARQFGRMTLGDSSVQRSSSRFIVFSFSLSFIWCPEPAVKCIEIAFHPRTADSVTG